ncbi:GntR family transcriptional regulator [Planctomycetota bacterium]
MSYRRVRDQITDLLREEIMTGVLEEGVPLREVNLAERFKVSRGPIRDAILQLTNEGLLDTQPNRGARVGRVWDQSLRPVMMGIRLELEIFGLKELLRQGKQLNIGPFRLNLRHFEIACRDEDLPAVVQLDMAFHRMILRESGHPGLESVWLPIMGSMRLPYSRHRKLIESYAEHKQIIDALEQGLEKDALAALKANIH